MLFRSIVLSYEDKLRDLFFGSWREDYEKLVELESLSAGAIKTKLNQIEREYNLYRLSKKESLRAFWSNK